MQTFFFFFVFVNRSDFSRFDKNYIVVITLENQTLQKNYTQVKFHLI